MMVSNDLILKRIEEECLFILMNTKRIESVTFFSDEQVTRACVYSLEIILSGIDKLDSDFKSQHSEIRWNYLINNLGKVFIDYLNPDYNHVWEVVENDIPHLYALFLERNT
jgi:uncharacterized protein with HEPN domain